MAPLSLNLPAVRRLALAAQGLLHLPQTPACKADVLEAILRMGILQIDTINVVARSPYFSLWSRLGQYNPAWLEQLLADGEIFEYWAHAASFLPTTDFPYHRRIALSNMRWHRQQEWYENHRETADQMLAHIRQNGAVKSSDFERSDGQKGSWWNWKIEKNVLEHWFTAGELMVARREKFQRVYDLRERVRPGWDDTLAPSLDETIRAMVLKTVHALGVSRPAWISDYYRLPKALVNAAIKSLQNEGQLVPVQVEGWPEPALAAAGDQEQLKIAMDGGLEPTLTTILPPFDALIWDRSRARQLFGFDYTIECYTPAPKRRYGYFILAILHRGALVGRLDAKAHRQEGFFEVKALYLEDGILPDENLAADLAGALIRCAEWHRTPQVVIRRCTPPGFLPLLEAHLSSPDTDLLH